MAVYYSAALGSISARLVSSGNVGAATYSNGNGGEGASLTATGNGALTVDTVSPSVGNIILLVGQTNTYENGPYIVTQTGSVSTPWILTRALFFNNLSQLVAGGTFIPIGAGSAGAGQIWVLVEPVPTTIGTDPITFIHT